MDLHEAARDGNLARLLVLLQSGASLTFRSSVRNPINDAFFRF